MFMHKIQIEYFSEIAISCFENTLIYSFENIENNFYVLLNLIVYMLYLV